MNNDIIETESHLYDGMSMLDAMRKYRFRLNKHQKLLGKPFTKDDELKLLRDQLIVIMEGFGRFVERGKEEIKKGGLC